MIILFLQKKHQHIIRIIYWSVIIFSLPNTAAVSFCRCTIGSTRGYDELIPIQSHVVLEKRKYTLLEGNKSPGISEFRLLMNEIHIELEKEGYTEFYVGVDGSYLTLIRQNPISLDTIYCITKTDFNYSQDNAPPIHVFMIIVY